MRVRFQSCSKFWGRISPPEPRETGSGTSATDGRTKIVLKNIILSYLSLLFPPPPSARPLLKGLSNKEFLMNPIGIPKICGYVWELFGGVLAVFWEVFGGILGDV